MAELFFLLAGVVLLFKKEVRISKRRLLTGRPVKILAALYIAPFIVSFIAGLTSEIATLDSNPLFWLSGALLLVAFFTTLYFIFFHKGTVPAN